MKYVNLLLIISVIFCYTGIGFHAHHSLISSSSGAYHVKQSECHKQEINESNIITGFYQSTDTTKHETLSCCHYMLPNALNSHDFNLVHAFLSPDLHTSVINKASSSTLNLEIKRKYQPPDLFLQNSSFLL
jgi:hypothetical protein